MKRHPVSPPRSAQRRRAVGAAFAAALGVGSVRAQAPASGEAPDAFPSRPVRLVVPYPPGGSTDQLARALQQPLAEFLRQPVIVDNRAGAGGAIGTDHVAKAAPDGYTLLFANSGPNAILPLLRRTPYDPFRDLRPVSTVAFMPMILAVPADSPARDLKGFVELARNSGGRWNFGSVGNGSMSHLAGEYFFNTTAQLKLVHVPFSGAAQMMTALVGGQLEAAFVTGMDGTAMVQAGRIRYLGIGLPGRASFLPELPAIGELIPGFSTVVWFGIMVPNGVQPAVAAKLHAAVTHAVARPDVQRMFIARNVEPRAGAPEDLDRLIRLESVQWGDVIRKGNITID